MKKLMTLAMILALAVPAFAGSPTVPPTEPVPNTVKETMPPAQKAKAHVKKAKSQEKKAMKAKDKKAEAEDKDK